MPMESHTENNDLVDGWPGCSSWAHMVGMFSMAGLVVALPPATRPQTEGLQTAAHKPSANP